MGATVAEKILARASGRRRVEPGEFIMATPDVMMGNEVSASWAVEIMKTFDGKPKSPGKLVLVPDHSVPNKDLACAAQCQVVRRFARQYPQARYFEVGRAGISHILMMEQGIVEPGDLLIGGDSHTCTAGAIGAFGTGVGFTDLAATFAMDETWMMVPETIKCTYHGRPAQWIMGKDLALLTAGQLGPDGGLYKALEYHGEAIDSLPVSGRVSLSNMAVEFGAKAGIVPVDDVTREFIRSNWDASVAPDKWVEWRPDPDARYSEEIAFDVDGLEPQVSVPSSPSNAHPVSEVAGVEVDQVFIGSCVNGMYEDIRVAASILRGKKVHPRVRLIVIPATPRQWIQASKEGLLTELAEAGAAVEYSCCGPCSGQHLGVLAEGETAISTTNRNFIGRMGHPKSKVYLASPAVAAASAVAGMIVPPEEVA